MPSYRGFKIAGGIFNVLVGAVLVGPYQAYGQNNAAEALQKANAELNEVDKLKNDFI